MQTNHNTLACDGAIICGEQFHPNSNTSQYAIYKLDGFTCGVRVCQGVRRPYMRLEPSIQVPKSGRKGFTKWVFEDCDDVRMIDVRLDKDDGEVVIHCELPSDRPEDIEPVLADALAWLQGSAYPALKAYSRQCWAKD